MLQHPSPSVHQRATRIAFQQSGTHRTIPSAAPSRPANGLWTEPSGLHARELVSTHCRPCGAPKGSSGRRTGRPAHALPSQCHVGRSAEQDSVTVRADAVDAGASYCHSLAYRSPYETQLRRSGTARWRARLLWYLRPWNGAGSSLPRACRSTGGASLARRQTALESRRSAIYNTEMSRCPVMQVETQTRNRLISLSLHVHVCQMSDSRLAHSPLPHSPLLTGPPVRRVAVRVESIESSRSRE